ncbi:glycosyltransferase family 4 protein [Corynebacterium sanguinis]|uniref:Glycosyltransferase family 4 protein n=1 Tax=Corynebacterium sanguinis TaxID=2594913 RepID=A0A6I7R9D9_9CORY|nr:glycosyltransferase family 4 protein [Corynebacterium sanguinis]MBA4506280.1 glycosyltransferase family 4 protein [Corynebacterium sanguinis]MCT1585374.1 glycosyltransferase family 4 protein [Corynebacterium sanguinis]MCT1629025.1 glycosyltransferase family 4 protein [Corynebacterium sanguinis]MCT2023301.1 glycosyltransferase family 4 protein [Corynebacterium sanguinis]MCT2046962.1 glycosyltransferase family 4 protein [Corynebacterium sanguinis]
MKILLLCWRDMSHPQGGGSERYIERVGEYLARHGHDVVLRTAAYTDAPRRSVKNGVRIERAGGKYGVYLLAPLAVWRHRPDVIVDTQNGIPFFARLYSRAQTVLLTHHSHLRQWPVAGPVIGRLGSFLERRVAPRVYRGAQYVTVSDASREDLIALGVRARDIAVVHNGVDPVPDIVPVQPDDGRIHLVTLSRLVPHKRIEQAIDIVRELDGVVLDVLGSGWWEDELRAHAAGLEGRVIFHGHVGDEYKHAVLARAALHLMPSVKEGWGIAVIEAAQHGVPTVGYVEAGGLGDSIVHGTTGLLVESEDEFRSAIERLLDDAVLRARLGENARQWAGRFSWEETGRRFSELIAGSEGSR